jgi:phage terminase large subunit
MRKMHKSVLEDPAIVRQSEILIRYHPRGASKELFHRRDPEILLAGPARTGKSYSALHKLHLVLSKYPGTKGFMARKTRTSMTNSCLMMYMQDVLKPPDNVTFHRTDQIFTYPNGSILAVIGLDDPERIKSTEWDIGYIQEATECTELDIQICITRLSHGVVPYQQLIMDCNPDRPTHWLKKRCDMGKTALLVSVLQDNPKYWNFRDGKFTAVGQAYKDNILENLSGVTRSRLYQGLWVAAEGMVYDEWDHQVNMISLADLPKGWDEWTHYWSIDFGYRHPFVWGDWIEDPQGRLYLYKQLYMTGRLVEDHAAQIYAVAPKENPKAIICDHDAEGRATLERYLRIYYNNPMLTLPAYKAILPGVEAVKARLKPNWRGKPGLYIVRDSLVEEDKSLRDAGKPVKTEDEWEGYVWDKTKNEGVNSKKDELPVDNDNHGMDQTRYMVAFADSVADDPQEEEMIMTYEDEVQISPF